VRAARVNVRYNNNIGAARAASLLLHGDALAHRVWCCLIYHATAVRCARAARSYLAGIGTFAARTRKRSAARTALLLHNQRDALAAFLAQALRALCRWHRACTRVARTSGAAAGASTSTSWHLRTHICCARGAMPRCLRHGISVASGKQNKRAKLAARKRRRRMAAWRAKAARRKRRRRHGAAIRQKSEEGKINVKDMTEGERMKNQEGQASNQAKSK